MQSILNTLDKKELLWATIKSLITVKRDREYYGTTPYTAETAIMFADMNPKTVMPTLGPRGMEHYSILETQFQVIIEDMKNLLYREVYMDVLCEVRDVRNLIDGLLAGESPLPESLDAIAELLDTLSANLAGLPLPKEMYKRNLEECVRLHEHRKVLM